MRDYSVQEIPVGQIVESAHNPRRHFDDEAMADLVASVRVKGVLVPVVVQPMQLDREGNATYELVAGARRVRAAQAVGLASVPAIVRETTEGEALEDAIVDNLQRELVPPLDEARSFRALIRDQDVTLPAVQTIARRVGKSERYVWDHLKLLDLIPEAQLLLEDQRITVAHAIRIARLTPEQQARVIKPHDGGLFEGEQALRFEAFDANRPDVEEANSRYDGLKAVTVRELDAWIARHVRFDVAQAAYAAPIDFGEAFDQVTEAAQQPGRGKKVVHITHEYHVLPDARDGSGRTFCSGSWKKADGTEGHPVCDRSVLGLVVVGPGYGQTFPVCVSKDCDVHWKKERLDREKRQRQAEQGATAGAKGENQWEREERERRERHAKEEAQRREWAACAPKLLEAAAAAVCKAKHATLTDLVLAFASFSQPGRVKRVAKVLPAPKTADVLLLHVALLAVMRELEAWNAFESFPKWAKQIGLDVAPVLKAHRAAAVGERLEDAMVAVQTKVRAKKAKTPAAKAGKKR